MFRLRTDEDVHVDVVDNAVLRVRRLTKNVVRWEHNLELPGVYADRFEKPVADTIDGWFGAAGELRLIVHARDSANPRLLPPRELTFAADGPRLERSRPGADRWTLASRPIRTHAWSSMTLQIVQEVDNHVLAVIDTAESKRLGWSVADLPDIGFRWFERSEIDHLPPPTVARPCSVCGSLPIFGTEHVLGMNPISVDRERGLSRRIVECHACLRSWQIEEVLEQGTMKPLWKWRQTEIRERAPIPRPTPAPASTPVATPVATPAPGPVERTIDPDDAAIGENLVIRFAGIDRALEVEAESAERIVLVARLGGPDAKLTAAGFVATSWEEDDKYNTKYGGCDHRLEVSKEDPRLVGPYLYWARYRTAIVRVIAERDGTMLVVAQDALAAELGFSRTLHGDLIKSTWLPRTVIERVQPNAPARSLEITPEQVRELTTVSFLGDGMEVRFETPDAFGLSVGYAVTQPQLVAAGFSERHLSDYRNDDDPGYYIYELTLAKTDPRLGGFLEIVTHQGRMLRVVENRGDHLLVLFRQEYVEVAGFTRGYDDVYYRWLRRDEINAPAQPVVVTPPKPEPVPPPTPSPASEPERIRDLFAVTANQQQVHDHVEIGYAPLPTYRFVVDSETSDRIVLRDSRNDSDARLRREGFSSDREEYQDRYEVLVSYEHRLTVPKYDARLVGAFRWRRYRGAIVRVIAEQPDRVLAVVHSTLGTALGFDKSHDLRIMQRWIPRDELEREPDVPTIDLDNFDDAFKRVRIVDCDVVPYLEAETPDTFVLEHRSHEPVPGLVAAGFSCDMGYDDRAGSEYHEHKATIAKTDHRLTGFVELVEYRGHQLRVIDRNTYGVFVIAHHELARVLGFPTRNLVCYGWLPHSSIQWVRPREHLLEPDRIKALARHLQLGFAPRGEEFAVEGEGARTITLTTVGEVPKPDSRLYGGAVLSWVRYRDHVLRVVAEEGDESLLVAHHSLTSALGFVALDIALCCRWVSRSDIEQLAVDGDVVSDPDLGRLIAVATRITGHDRVDVDSRSSRILAETPTTLDVEHADGRRETLGKRDARITGPFEALVMARGGNHYRLVLEFDRKYLVVVHDSFPDQFKLMRLPNIPGAFRWFESSDVSSLGKIANASTEDLSRYAPVDITIDGVAHRCAVKNEISDAFDVVLGGGDLRIDKLDQRVGGPFERIGTFEGMQVRVIGDRAGKLLIVVDDAYANRVNGWEKGPGIGWRLVDPELVTEPPPNNDSLYRSLRVTHADHERGQPVLEETADTFTLPFGIVAKTDPKLRGPYGRLVVFKRNLLRVAEERGGKFLVIAHGPLGSALGFTSYTYDGQTLGWAWFRPSELDAV